MLFCRLSALRTLVTLVALLLSMNLTARAQSGVTLAWNASPGGAIAGYRVYSGGATRTYTNLLDVGNTTTGTVSGLAAGTTYFFAVTAYDLFGLESAFSAEISYAVPTAPSTPVNLKLAFTATGQPALTATTHPGYAYAVLASTNLSNWSTIGNAVSDTTGLLQFIEARLPTNVSRYYRLQQTSP
jgi:Fibronectin type III domain